MSLKPFSTFTKNSSESNFQQLDQFSTASSPIKDKDFP